jgi:uncharacterized membrane protein
MPLSCVKANAPAKKRFLSSSFVTKTHIHTHTHTDGRRRVFWSFLLRLHFSPFSFLILYLYFVFLSKLWFFLDGHWQLKGKKRVLSTLRACTVIAAAAAIQCLLFSLLRSLMLFCLIHRPSPSIFCRLLDLHTLPRIRLRFGQQRRSIGRTVSHPISILSALYIGYVII